MTKKVVKGYEFTRDPEYRQKLSKGIGAYYANGGKHPMTGKKMAEVKAEKKNRLPKTGRTTKVCTKCGLRIERPRIGKYYCDLHLNEYQREWRKKEALRTAESHKRHYHKRRLEVLAHYGGNPPTCACCSEQIFNFLTIDHVNNDGNGHRKQIKKLSIYQWLRNNGFPEGFQVLCFNCNCGKSINKGICPHQA